MFLRKNKPAPVYATAPFGCEEAIVNQKQLLAEAQAQAAKHVSRFQASTAPGLAELTAETFNGQVNSLKSALETVSKGRGCEVQYILGEQSVRAVCESQQCPFFPNGPDSQ